MLYVTVSHEQRTKKARKQGEAREKGRKERKGRKGKEKRGRKGKRKTMKIFTFVRLESLNHCPNHGVRGAVAWPSSLQFPRSQGSSPGRLTLAHKNWFLKMCKRYPLWWMAFSRHRAWQVDKDSMQIRKNRAHDLANKA